MNGKRKQISLYIFAHFIVDFACAFLTFRILINSEQMQYCLLLYNFCAFALQMPIGLLADRWNRNACCAALGCGFVALAYGFGNVALVSSVIAGVGNGLFHVGGGIDVLNAGKEKPILLGLFVSPGALGIYFGTFFGKQEDLPVFIVVTCLLFLAIGILALSYLTNQSLVSNNSAVSFKQMTSAGVIVALAYLFLVVCLRSYIGMTSNFSWKSTGMMATVYVCAVVIGKISGGFLAAVFGVKKTSTLSLGTAAMLFLFSSNPWLGVMAVFFFNMTMSITLWAVAKILTGCKGFSFGLLTFGLFLGFIPVYLELPIVLSTTVGFSIASMASLILLIFGLRKAVV